MFNKKRIIKYKLINRKREIHLNLLFPICLLKIEHYAHNMENHMIKELKSYNFLNTYKSIYLIKQIC